MSFNQNAGAGPGRGTGIQGSTSANGNNSMSLSEAPRTASASPAGVPGTTPQNGPPKMRMRRKQQTNPLVQNKRQAPKLSKPKAPPAASNRPNKTALATRPANAPQPSSSTPNVAPPPQPTESIAVYTTKKSAVEGLRHHIMRIHPPPARKSVDLYDESQFTPPLRLHRRDPRAPAVGAAPAELPEEERDTVEDDKERERLEILKEERKRIREENQAQIAPSQKKNRPAAFQKKTEQVYRKDDTPEARKKQQLRYEESLPWHLEDFDNKNTWVGTYEAALSEHYVMFVKDQGVFRVVPVEKWYRFTSKQRGKTWTAEQADAAFEAKTKAPRWFAAAELKDAEQKMKKRERMNNKPFLGAAEGGRRRRGDDEGNEVVEDVNEMDYNMEEDFADDEEGVNGLFEGEDEDTKMASDKIKKEQLEANVFELRDEKDVWKQEEKEKKEAEERKKLEKQMRKALLKREKNYDYEDSDGNPYSDSSESLDSEEERKKDEELKKDEEKKGKSKEAEKTKLPTSGASTKGNNTPSGRNKVVDKKPVNSLGKRPGSPNLSEASGNESARKKAKKAKHNLSQPTPTISRPMSPDLQPSSSAPNSKLAKMRMRGGSGSESEMTEGGRKQKLKLRLGQSPAGTPSGSRAGSPAAPGVSPAGSPVLSAGGAHKFKASSPASGTTTPTASNPATVASSNLGMPTAEEILAAVPPEGLPMNSLLAKFRNRFKSDKQYFTSLVKGLLRLDKETRMLYRK